MRDIETIRLALTAAETGHLVFATLHTDSAPKTIDRIVDVFVTQNGGQRRLPVGANNEVPKDLPPENGIKDIQKRATTAAKSYLSQGNAAVAVSADEEWQQF